MNLQLFFTEKNEFFLSCNDASYTNLAHLKTFIVRDRI